MKEPQPLHSCNDFRSTPLMVVNVSHQNETIRSSPIDVQI